MIYSTPLQVCLGKLPDSLWKAKKSNSTKTKKKKVYFEFFERSWWKSFCKLDHRSSPNVTLVSPKRPRSLPSPKCFCSFLDFLKLLSQSHKFRSQPNVKKSFWNQKKSSYVLNIIWKFCYTFRNVKGAKRSPLVLEETSAIPAASGWQCWAVPEGHAATSAPLGGRLSKT